MGVSYKDAGVDIEAGNKAVKRMKNVVQSTFTDGVLSDIGGFGGMFAPGLDGLKEPVLVSGTDGVGTKLKVAFLMNQHQTIGIDLVAMCVNDILAQGARPLFFLDYLATGKLNPEKAEKIVEGIAEGCKQSSCALIGGETAELPDFYQKGEYDLAGFAVGLVDKSKIITGKNICSGDKIIGLASNGIHSNGYSLVRKIFFDIAGYNVGDKIKGLDKTLGEELLTPTRIYVRTVLELIKKYNIKGISHITGGGFLENIPRILPESKKAVIDKDNWPTHKIFDVLQTLGNVKEREMYRTFNMGIGMVLVVSKNQADQVIKTADESGEKAYLIGEIRSGNKGIEITTGKN